MRFFSAALLSSAALISQLSLAGTPASSDEQLGAVQAAVDFCSRVVPEDRERIEKQAKLVLPDMTKARVEAARHGAKFQQAYQVIDSVLKGIELPEAARLCASAIPVREHEPKEHEPKEHERRETR
jgi:hypothetical protein